MPKFYQHPQYTELKEDWERWRTLYKGDPKKLKAPEFLYPHALESKPGDAASADLRRNRELRTSYLNIPEIMVSLWLSYYFAKPPKLEAKEGSIIKAASKNIDGEKRSLNRFLRDKVTAPYLAYGKVAILADSFGMEVASLAEQKEKGVRPFLEIVEPLDLIDWSIEKGDPARMGDVNWVRHEYKLVGDRADPEQAPESFLYSVTRKKTPLGYVIQKYRRKIQELGNGQTVSAQSVGEDSSFEQVGEDRLVAIPEVPIVILEDESWLKDLVGEVVRHYNLRSGLDNVNYYQGYQKIFVKGVISEQHLKALSEYIVSLLPEGGDAFAIDSVDTLGLERAVESALISCFKIGLNQLRTLPADSKEQPSAEAANAEKINTTQLVEQTIEDLENASNKALEHFALLAGEAPAKVCFNREISEPGVEQILIIYNAMKQEFGNCPEIPKAMVEKLLYKLFPNEDEANKLIEVVEKTPLPKSQAELQADRTTLLEGVIGGRRTSAGSSADQSKRTTDQQVRREP